jgi:mRNA interferase HigB
MLPIWEIVLSLCEKTMRVIAKRILREFWEVHQDCKEQLKSWFNEAEKADWQSPDDIKMDYPSASILKSQRVIFNIKGNTYRLIVKINYDYGIVWIRFIGTHEEYDKIDTETI